MNNLLVHSVQNFPCSFIKEAQIQNSNEFSSEVLDALSKPAFQDVRLKMCKMIVIGDTGVGKTTLVHSFCNNHFDANYVPTIGVDFAVQRFKVLNTPFTLQMWDTAGQERFHSISSAYYRGVDVIVVVFDLTNKESLENSEAWLFAAKKENCNTSKLQVYLVGTKKDLLPHENTAGINKTAIQMAKMLQAEYWQVSAKSSENVQQLFFRIAALAFEASIHREIKQKVALSQAQSITLVNDINQTRKNQMYCC